MKRIAALALAGSLLLAGCSAPAGGGQETGSQDQLREISVVLDWYPNALHAFLYDAIEKGYF